MKARALWMCLVLAVVLAPLAAAQDAPAAPAPGEKAPALSCQNLADGLLQFAPAPSDRNEYPNCDVVCAQALYECTVVCPDYVAFRCAPVTCTAQCLCPED